MNYDYQMYQAIILLETYFFNLGTVIRCTLTKLLEYQHQYICNKCHHVFDLSAEFEQNYIIPKPIVCPSPEGCNSIKFVMSPKSGSGAKKCKDYQEIKIQEQVLLTTFCLTFLQILVTP